MRISTTVSDTTRATITVHPEDGNYYIVVEMSRGEVKCARLWRSVDRCPLSEDISLLFTSEEAPSILERVRLAIVAEEERIKRIMKKP